MLLDILNGSKPDNTNTTNNYYCATFEEDYESENDQMHWYIQNFFNKYGIQKELSCEFYEKTILNSLEKLTIGLDLSMEGLEHLKEEFERNVKLRNVLNSTLEYDDDSYESPFTRLGGISTLLENFKNFAFAYLKDIIMQLNKENYLPFQDIYKKN